MLSDIASDWSRGILKRTGIHYHFATRYLPRGNLVSIKRGGAAGAPNPRGGGPKRRLDRGQVVDGGDLGNCGGVYVHLEVADQVGPLGRVGGALQDGDVARPRLNRARLDHVVYHCEVRVVRVQPAVSDELQ